MIAVLKPGVTLDPLNGPIIETERLILRPWRSDDIAPNTAMLGDPVAGRFITADGSPSPTHTRDGAMPRSWPGTGRCTALACSWGGETDKPVCRTRWTLATAWLAGL